MVYGQKTTGQKTTKNANPGQKTTRTKRHHRRNFVVYFDEVYNELSAYTLLWEIIYHVCCVSYHSHNNRHPHTRRGRSAGGALSQGTEKNGGAVISSKHM